MVGVCRGFVGNRMLFMRGAEAERMILEGATPAQVDSVLYEFGFPMGPFAMSDLAGLDIGWKEETSSELDRSARCSARTVAAARRTAAATTPTTPTPGRPRPTPRSSS